MRKNGTGGHEDVHQFRKNWLWHKSTFPFCTSLLSIPLSPFLSCFSPASFTFSLSFVPSFLCPFAVFPFLSFLSFCFIHSCWSLSVYHPSLLSSFSHHPFLTYCITIPSPSLPASLPPPPSPFLPAWDFHLPENREVVSTTFQTQLVPPIFR